MTTETAPRKATISRKTKETEINCSVNLDGTGERNVSTGIGFLDHLLDAFSCHGKVDLELTATGDLHIDDHHTVEDVAIVLSTALKDALGDAKGISRFSTAFAPLDEALVRTVLDISGRPYVSLNLPFTREMIGVLETENILHFFETLALRGQFTMHMDIVRGDNNHHIAEAAMKSFALAFREAVKLTGETAIPSTKGVLTDE